MELTGEYRIAAPRETVWAALNDPDVLRQAIPGCQSLDQKEDGGFAAAVLAKVGPVKATFKGDVALNDLDPPNGYTLRGEGAGGAAGFAKGEAKVTLAEDAGETVLSYVAQVQIGGKLAQIGSRLVKGASQKNADDFFATFAEIVGGPRPDEDGDQSAAAKAPPSPGGVPRWAYWAGGAAAAAIFLLLLL